MKQTYSWRRTARVTHRHWPDRCPVCDRFVTRRAGSHRLRCTRRATAALHDGGWS